MSTARHFRWTAAADSGLLADIMFDSVRNGESPYSEPQRAAWVPARPSGEAWEERLRGRDIVVAEQDGAAAGFAALAGGGYIDLVFIRPNARKAGLFRQLISRLIETAAAKGERRLWTHASLAAEPAFARLGFTVRKRERVRIGDQRLDRCEMEMQLAAD
ncbi:MAG TPA: GNAT family N-acetyltransferase [Allosphingosinicella sp.]|jgi:putative acetyltransferase